MDFNGDNLLYLYKKPKKMLSEPGPDFLVSIFNCRSLALTELNDFKPNIKCMRLFQKGFIYVRDNKNVIYFDIEAKKEQFLFSHNLTIVTLATFESRVATIDKGLFVNVFNFDSFTYTVNEENIMQLSDLPSQVQKIRFFEMEYPYFSHMDGSRFAFTNDFGTMVISYKERHLS